MQEVKIKKDPYDEVKLELIVTGTREEHNRQEGFFYWSKKIVLMNLPDDAVIPPNLINFSAEPYGLTLLHVAAISANTIAFTKLLDCGANPNACDKRGWTTAHHLCFLGKYPITFTKALREKGADFSIKNDLYATADKLYELISLQETRSEPCYWRDRIDSPIKQKLEGKQYFHYTNSLCITENLVDPSYLIENWRNPKEAVQGLFPFTPEIASQYALYKKNPPKHILIPVLTDSSGTKLPASPGLGLYSNGTFPAHRIVGEYLGKLSRNNIEGAYTTVGGWDAEKYSSPATRINSSFPNVAMMRLPACDGIEGLPYRIVFVSLEEVNGQFCWNYGNHLLKFGPYIEQRPKEMRDFIRNNDTKQLVASLLREVGDQCQDWHTYAQSEKLRYILQTPSALFLLTLEGLLPEKEAQKLLDVALMGGLLMGNKSSKRCVASAAGLRAISQKLTGSAPEIPVDIEKFFQQLSAQLSFADLLDTAESTTKRLTCCDTPTAEWERIKIELERDNNGFEEASEAKHFDKDAEKILTSTFGKKFRTTTIPAFSQNSLTPQLFGKREGGEEYAVGGIGRKLNKDDIGKDFVRTLPREISPGHYDWSFVPVSGNMTHQIQTLVKIEEECFWMKPTYIFFPDPYKIGKDYLNNWIEADRYEEALKAVLEKATPEQKAHVLDFKKNAFKDSSLKKPRKDKPSFPLRRPSERRRYQKAQAKSSPFSKKSQESNDIDLDSIFLKLKERAADAKKAAEQQAAEKLSAKAAAWEKNKEAWQEDFFKKLPEKPASKDYSQVKAEDSKKPVKVPLPAALPRFYDADPRAVLGLHSDEKDLTTITKQYRKLALCYHPDKGGEEELFKCITKAYKALLNELHPTPFKTDLFLSEEENYLLAAPYFLQLAGKKGKLEERTGEWETFVQELKTLENHPKRDTASAQTLLIGRLVLKAESKLSFHKLLMAIDEQKMPVEELSMSLKVSVFKENLCNLEKCISQFDLNNEKTSWPYEGIEDYKKAHLLLMDKYLAFSRSLAEAYGVLQQKEELLQLRKDALKFYAEQKYALKKGCQIADDDEKKYQRQLAAKIKKQPDPNNSKETPKQEKSDSKADEEKSQKKAVPPKQIDILKANIKANKRFFTL